MRIRKIATVLAMVVMLAVNIGKKCQRFPRQEAGKVSQDGCENSAATVQTETHSSGGYPKVGGICGLRRHFGTKTSSC